MKIGSLFSGIGGLELGLERAGLGHVVWQVEQDEFCRRVLAKHWPGADRSITDVRHAGAATLVPVDIICGGFPCQDVSGAGRGAGLDGARSGLWWEFRRIVAELRPAIVVVENVASGAKRWLCAVRWALHELGYRTRALGVAARDVGAPHRRERIFVVAYADGIGGVSWPCGARPERAGRTEPRGIGPDVGDPERSRRQGAIDPSGAALGRMPAWPGGRIGEAQRGLGGGAARLPHGMDESGRRSAEARQEEVDGTSSGICAAENVRRVPAPDGAEALQWTPGGQGRLHATQVLRSDVQRHCPTEADAVAGGAAEACGGAPRKHMPNLQLRGEATGSSYRWRPVEQRSDESDDALRAMPHEVALAARQDDIPSIGHHHRWPAARGQAQHAWEPPRTVNHFVPKRRARLRALGNAVVPQCAEVVGRWVLANVSLGTREAT